MNWTSTAFIVAISTFAQFSTLSSSFLILNPQDESQLVVVRKYNEQCQWYNSGFMGLIPRTFNRTTICRCKFIGVYECSTLTVHKSNSSSSSSEPNRTSWTFLHSRKFKAPAPPPPQHNSTLSSSGTTSNTTSSSTDTNDKADKKSLSTTTSTMGLFPHFSQGTSIEEPLVTSSSARNSSLKAVVTSATNLQETTANYIYT